MLSLAEATIICTSPPESLPLLPSNWLALEHWLDYFWIYAGHIKAISGPSPPGPKMLLLPYRMLTISFAGFDASVYRFQCILLVPSTLALLSSCNFTDFLISRLCHLCNRLNRVCLHLLLLWLLIQSLLPPVPPRLNPLILLLRPLVSSLIMTFSILTFLSLKVHHTQFRPILFPWSTSFSSYF